MRKFFFAIKKSACGPDCRWQICPQRYLTRLRKINGLQSIRPIFGDVVYVSPPSDNTPRNGDLIILYAENSSDLDAMVAARDNFDGLKKILVMADSAGVNGDKYHMLAPRFITQVERNIDELEAVIQKMNGYVQ